MATGRSNYLTKQTGEYLVAAELSRRELIATTFTGNVPHYDIVAVDEKGGHALVQVKAISGGSWQLNAGQFAIVEFEGDRQIVRGPRPEPCPGLVCVLVQVVKPDSPERDRFFVVPWTTLADLVTSNHRNFLARHGGVRPKRPDSLHTVVARKEVEAWENRWEVFNPRVRPAEYGQSSE